MANKTYSVTLSDGSVGTRKSPRPYTHAIVVTFTQAHLDRRILREEDAIRVLESNIRLLEPRAATPEDKIAYAEASARHAYLNEVIHYERNGVALDQARWLTDEFPIRRGFDECQKNTDALCKTFQYKINRARADIEIAQKAIERYSDLFAVGVCVVHGWSQSASGAAKAAEAAKKAYPLAEVAVRADIQVKEHGTRGPRGAAEVVTDEQAGVR